MIKIVAIGKMKNQELLALVQEYFQRLQKFDKAELIELKDSTLEKEAEKILEKLEKFKGAIFAMSEEGEEYTSIEFSKLLEKNPNSAFIIGSAYGLSDKVREKATKIISISKMTFTHEFARCFLMEQLYRAKTISAKTGYHH